VFWFSSLGDALAFACSGFLIPQYCISCHIGDNVSFKFGDVAKHSICLFVCIYLFLTVYKFFVAMLLIGHDLHRNYGLHAIGVFNLFEHCISLEIPTFDLCVGLERLYLFDFFSHAH
jgi:hypothetical protein